MINLAKRPDDTASHQEVDRIVLSELSQAGIEPEGPFEFLRKRGEVPSAYVGNLCMWGFERFWTYWVAKGPGVPPDEAQAFHEKWGRVVRVEGHCGCPSPLEWCKGFAVNSYHIDTQEGLNAFAALLRSIYVEKVEEPPAPPEPTRTLKGKLSQTIVRPVYPVNLEDET